MRIQAMTTWTSSIDWRTSVAVFLLAFIAGGCASTVRMTQQPAGPHDTVNLPVPVEPELTQGEQVVGIASTMLGKPYRYGGDSPKKGFDCSGLVFYSFEQMGIKVPRTAADQRRAAEQVKKSQPRARRSRVLSQLGRKGGSRRHLHRRRALHSRAECRQAGLVRLARRALLSKALRERRAVVLSPNLSPHGYGCRLCQMIR